MRVAAKKKRKAKLYFLTKLLYYGGRGGEEGGVGYRWEKLRGVGWDLKKEGGGEGRRGWRLLYLG